MKKINVSKSYEKVKVSLAIEKEILELLDNALFGFKLVNMLAQEKENLVDFLSSKNEAQYKSIFNRSELLSKILETISKEKLFVVNNQDYSLKDLSEIGDEIAFNSMFDIYVDMTQLFNISNLGSFKEKAMNDIKDLTVEQTFEYLRRRRGFGEVKYSIITSKKGLDDTSEITWDHLDDMYLNIDNLNTEKVFSSYSLFSESFESKSGFQWSDTLLILFGSNKNEKISDVETKIEFQLKQIQNLYKKTVNINEVYKKSEEMDFLMKSNYYSWEMQSKLSDRLAELTIFAAKGIYKDIPDLLKVKILRNHLFDEGHRYHVHLFEQYLIHKFDLDLNYESRDFYDEAL
ncbi:MAG: hypothetical protein KGZ84_07860 [Erysipelotrichia bacterium]|jgi:hypothetical protein|nr:hypothetical protein [Erysipelotrichia bacterium]